MVHSFWRERDDRRGVRAGRGVGIDAAAREYAPPRGLWGWSRPSLSDVHLGMKASSHRCVLCAPSKARVDFLVVTRTCCCPDFPLPTTAQVVGSLRRSVAQPSGVAGQFSRGIVDPKRIIPVTTVLGFAWTCKFMYERTVCKNPIFLLLKLRSNLGVKTVDPCSQSLYETRVSRMRRG